MLIVADVGITLGTVAEFDGQVVHCLHVLEYVLILEIPHQTHGPERCPAVVLTETGGCVITYGCIHEIPFLIVVVRVSEE